MGKGRLKSLLDGEEPPSRRWLASPSIRDWSRNRRRVTLGIITLALFTIYLLSGSPRSTHVTAVSSIGDKSIQPRLSSIPIKSDPSIPRILILQHIYTPPITSGWGWVWSRLWLSIWPFSTRWRERELYEASIVSHRRYAQVWGYGYRLERGSWLAGDSRRSKHLNKVYSLLEAVLEEVGKGEGEGGAEWIMVADADTLILDPSIPLHHLLPSFQITPSPLILANQDHRGFNAGVMVFRVSIRVASFLLSMIANEPILHAETGIHPSDQHLLGYTIQQRANEDVSKGFYQIPQRWLNSYWVDDGTGVGLGTEPMLHVHLVNQRKWQEDWRVTVLGYAEGVYAAAGVAGVSGIESEAGEGVDNEVGNPGIEGDGEEVLGSGRMMQLDGWKVAKDSAERWWRSARGGIEGIHFNEI